MNIDTGAGESRGKDRNVSHIKTLFWSSKIRSAGYIYGWLNSNGSACAVGTILAENIQQAEEVVERRALPTAVSSSCGFLSVLGICETGTINNDFHRRAIAWLSERGTIRAANPQTKVVVYDPPNARQLRLLSCSPLQLDITSYSATPARPSPKAPTSRTSKLEDNATLQLNSRRSNRSDVLALDLDLVILQINNCYHVAKVYDRGADGAPSAMRGWPSTFEIPAAVQSLLTRTLGFFLHAINLRFWRNNALKDVSAFVNQLDVRLQQAVSSPRLFRASYEQDLAERGASHANYINFYNTLWLVANDVIIGSALLTFLCENSDHLAGLLATALKKYTVKSLQDTLLWLNNWPGGLKLNYELGKFFCDAFLWFTVVWEELFIDALLVPALPHLIYFIGLLASFGTTFAISALADLLAIVTLHIYAFYVMVTAVFSFHTRAMGSLFNIFRGKKRNVLRERSEPAEYQLDQLLIGAILFTLAAFLLPTVLVYYLVFAVTRLGIISLQATFEALLVFLNHFPLFCIMLRLKDPQRLPGGLAFELVEGEGTVLRMKNNPISYSSIFYQYWAVWSAFSRHYSPVFLLGKILTGRYIHAIPRSRLTFSSLQQQTEENGSGVGIDFSR